MHFQDFKSLNISAAEGVSSCECNERVVQFVRISLDPKSGKRASSIHRVIENYNKMENRLEKVEPITYFPNFSSSSVICFKKAAPVDLNPILSRIAQARTSMNPAYWRWTLTATGPSLVTNAIEAGFQQDGQRPSSSSFVTKRRVVTSISDILSSMKLPESDVSVQRAYDELSEPYFREFKIPMGEGTGCIPVEHREFVVSEIQRLFEEELSYIQQPSIVKMNGGSLPAHAASLVDNAGWMGDILLSGECMDTLTGGAAILGMRVENAMARNTYVKTGKRISDRLERRGVGNTLREFFIFYALEWNVAGYGSVFQSIDTLYDGWVGAMDSKTVFQSLIAGIGLSSYVKVDGGMMRVPSVDRLLELLCSEGLIVVRTSSSSSLRRAPVVKRMTVVENCNPVASITKYFQRMLGREWVGLTTVEVTAADVVRVLNGGEVGAYKRSCVSQFMRPFLFDGSVEGYSWLEGAVYLEKYIVHVESVSKRLSDFSSVL